MAFSRNPCKVFGTTDTTGTQTNHNWIRTFSRPWNRCIFSRVWCQLHFFPPLVPVAGFPALGTCIGFGVSVLPRPQSIARNCSGRKPTLCFSPSHWPPRRFSFSHKPLLWLVPMLRKLVFTLIPKLPYKEERRQVSVCQRWPILIREMIKGRIDFDNDFNICLELLKLTTKRKL